ncbi:MAG TPA: NnrS family protein [Marinospirillum sp.]|uniref:NnrS family protein n=1 Tax=Marinospirillum sp. TaxID=2183934 RepID=UPI002B486367|nr:NnrS family protein [Marinospirillum sp.]HKM15239.1 NnrS family protein [Marinospirillum sp.]
MAFFALGFRPFFLLAAVGGFMMMLVWILTLSLGYSWPGVDNVISWHRHEMLFGYTGAVIAGFLLTSVRNWTGKSTPKGKPLAALVIIWVMARLAPLVSEQQLLYVALDLLFWVGLFISLWHALISAAFRNRVFLLLVGLLGTAAALSHWSILQPDNANLSYIGAYLGLDIILIIMLIMGGRVIPFFIQRGLQKPEQARNPRLEKGLPPLLLIMLAINLLLANTPWVAVINFILACWLLPNLWRWHDKGIWHKPLLWSLYLAYAWIILGLLLRSFGVLGWVSPYLGVHALTVGGIGLLTLSMMSRVGLGHTGRALEPTKLTVIALGLMMTAAVVRVFLASSLGLIAYQISAALWMLALLIFVVVYLPILTQPRPDGKAG